MHNENQKLQYEILELFPTPVFTTIIPNQFGKVTEYFYKQEMSSDVKGKDDPGIDSINYGERSTNSYILDEPECKDLKTFILDLSKNYGDMLGYDYETYRFGQSWTSYKHPGQQHIQHTHPNSLMSGVLYFGPPQPETSAIKLHKAAGSFNSNYISPKKVLDKRELKYAWEEFNLEFSPGLLIIFPSHLTHSVPLNKTDTIRCSLAFNIVPTVGFGEETSLTELKF
tara:strand:+ start:2393 stop:3070 length:678 start_codon:yes stop_codon:yes gene_type:complete